MTNNKEDYLKELYNLNGTKEIVANKMLADRLNVSSASVTEMLLKLRADGLITYEAYKGSKLTEEGFQVAVALVRGHRLWEVFLIKYLKYTWSEAHEEANLLEHISPSRLVERLDEFLNFPEYCPHGNAIPHSDGTIEKLFIKPLSELAIGEEAIIKKVIEEKDLMDYLQKKGIEIGEKIKILSIGEYDSMIDIKTNKGNLSLSYKAACRVYVV